MKTGSLVKIVTLIVVTGLPGLVRGQEASDLDKLKSTVESLQQTIKSMQQTIEQQNQKISDLEKGQKAAAPAIAAPAVGGTGGVEVVTITPAPKEVVGHASPIEDRSNFNDEQTSVPRPNDQTLDPKYRGYIPVPNTPVVMKFNAKPRLDAMSDTRNSGDPDRFVTAKIPVEGESGFGGPEQFNINARGSQLKWDVRTPDMPGNFRFYYENDFFGSGSGMQYRLRYLYGQYYNFTIGQAASVFQDPDAWPDTVDYEGPNGGILTRRPLARYTWLINPQWQLNLSVEQPSSEVSSTNSITQQNRAPDGGFNIRWEKANVGHVQYGMIFRDVGAESAGFGTQDVFGWGASLSSSFKVFEKDSVQEQVTYGEGVFKYCNDDFVNNDAAFAHDGDLEPIPFFGSMVGYTHQWSDAFRSTASFGYVHLNNFGSQGPTAYYQTYYSSANLIWQMRKRLTLGLEGLWGYKEEQSGQVGDVWRVQLSAKYSLFD
ncbi:MAG TPA: DcaP family trimeric outer membrane transporter [Verrucomicrobiae bacterium]|nr:DcaP family trimeric outer membrane transporter [Verrucomicrobiae bacterium]